MFTDGIIKPRRFILRKLNIECRRLSYNVAEVLKDFWVIAPIYAYNQSAQPYLYEHYQNFKDYIPSFGISFSTLEAIRSGKINPILLQNQGMSLLI